MADLTINEHSPLGWAPLRDEFGFVPDPMIMRAAEIFLNGATGSKKIHGDGWAMSRALHENFGGISDFFDYLRPSD